MVGVPCVLVTWCPSTTKPKLPLQAGTGEQGLTHPGSAGPLPAGQEHLDSRRQQGLGVAVASHAWLGSCPSRFLFHEVRVEPNVRTQGCAGLALKTRMAQAQPPSPRPSR